MNRLAFHCSEFGGNGQFAAMKWRLAEIADPKNPAYKPNEPRPYEITPVWESDEITAFKNDVTIAAAAVKVGHAYRVRARMQDNTGRWSHWSEPVQFVAGEPSR